MSINFNTHTNRKGVNIMTNAKTQRAEDEETKKLHQLGEKMDNSGKR